MGNAVSSEATSAKPRRAGGSGVRWRRGGQANSSQLCEPEKALINRGALEGGSQAQGSGDKCQQIWGTD